MKISLLCPTRKRPDNITRLLQSIGETASNKDDIDIWFYVDEDDTTTYEFLDQINSPIKYRYYIGERIVLSEMWNKICEFADGEIFLHAGDDIVFRTEGWDDIIRGVFTQYDDKIVFVYGNDGIWDSRNFGTHGFIHRNWVDTVGYFVPPYFSSDMNDVWLNDVADALNRKVKVPILTEHMHPCAGKGKWDETHYERLERGKRDNVYELYKQKQSERDEDIRKLQAFIDQFEKNK